MSTALPGAAAGRPASADLRAGGDLQPNVRGMSAAHRSIVQRNRLRGETRIFEVVRRKYLIARQHTLFRSTTHYMELPLIHPSPRYVRRIPRLWLGGSLGAAAATGALAGWGAALGLPTTAVLSGGTAFALLAIAGLGVTGYLWRNQVVFFARFSRTPVFSLYRNRPGRRQFREFMSDLRAAIAEAAAESEQRSRRQKHLRRSEIEQLRRDGMVSERQYQELLREHEAAMEDTINSIRRDVRNLKAREIRALRRLNEQGLLGAEAYEAARTRVLETFE